MKYKDAKVGMGVVITECYARKYKEFFTHWGVDGELLGVSRTHGYIKLFRRLDTISVSLRKFRSGNEK